MRKFILNVVLLTVVNVILLLFFALCNFYTVKKQFKNYHYNDYIFIGDSSFEQGINPNIIENSLNLSESASSMVYSYLKIKTIVENFKPKKIIIPISSHNIFSDIEKRWLFSQPHFESRFAKYFPLMGLEELKLFLYSKEISYASSFQKTFKEILKNTIIGNIYYGRFNINNLDNLKKAISKLDDKTNRNYTLLAEVELNYFKKIIKLCNNSNIDLIVINTPKHKMYNKFYEKRITVFNDLMKNEFSDIIYYDYTNLIFDNSCFTDLMHLNNKGSSFFSEYIKDNLKKNNKNVYHFD